MTVLCASLFVVCLFDYRKGKIPNLSVLAVLAAGVGRSVFFCGLKGLGVYLLVAVAALLFLYPFFRIGGLGAGDVKLLSVCAGYFPVCRICYFLFFSMLISVLFSIVKLYREHGARERVAYFCEYCAAVARSGKWRLYLPEKNARKFTGICMSGPILCSVLLGLGGVY